MQAEHAGQDTAAAPRLRGPAVPRDPPRVAHDDHGAFRAADPVSGAALVIRPTAAALEIQGSAGARTIPWGDIREVHLLTVPANTLRIAAARVEVRDGPPLDLVRMHVSGGELLPEALVPGGPALVRVERMRLLVAAIVARAGLAAVEEGVFARGARLVPPVAIAARPRILPEWAPPALLGLSVLGLVWVFDLTLTAALLVTVVLLVHEYGHVVAMRALGLRVRGVLFLPLLGAATVPEQAFPSRYTEARVALAGPMTGLPLALAVVLAARLGALSGELLEQAFMWTLALNVLNLVPMLPLDGGRTLLTLTAALPLRLRRVVQYAPIALAAALLLAFVRGPAGLLAGVFVVFSAVVTGLAFRRQSMHAWMEGSGLDLAALRTALRDVSHVTSGFAREDVDGGVPPAPMSAAEVGGVLLVYGVVTASLLGIVVAARLWPGLLGFA